MHCLGCTFTHFPPCAIRTIYSASKLDDIINNKQLKQITHPVCHANAQVLDANRIFRNENCDNCGACSLCCTQTTTGVVVTDRLERASLTNLNRLNIICSAVLPEAIVITEAKAKGNAREKRVDMVIKKDHRVYLVKILTDIDKYPYYHRSYEDIVKHYHNQYPEIQQTIHTVVPSKKIDSAIAMGYHCITLSDFLQMITEA